jgi:hypothetical protein
LNHRQRSAVKPRPPRSFNPEPTEAPEKGSGSGGQLGMIG